jgi:hypothetical protein
MAKYKIGDSVARETKRVADANLRTEELGLKSTLTVGDWLKIIARYKNTCAYCGRAANCLEHLKPVKFGGGTTKKNCVPACASCNKAKGNAQTGWVPRMQYVDEVKYYALERCQFRVKGGMIDVLGEEINKLANLAVKHKYTNGFCSGILMEWKSPNFGNRWERGLFQYIPYSEKFPQGYKLDDIWDFDRTSAEVPKTGLPFFLVGFSIPSINALAEEVTAVNAKIE